MAPDNSEIMALLADLLRATDRQTEANTRAIDQLREGMHRTAQETNQRFEAMFNRFAEAVADGFIRVEKKIDGVKQEVAEVKEEVANVKAEVAGLRTDVQHIDERLARVEANQSTQADMLRRLEVLENIVLRKAS